MYLKEVSLTSFILFLGLVIFLSLSFQEIIIFFVLFILFVLLLLNFIGKKRINEITTIKSIIKKIRKNKLNSPDEIKLDNSLVELEGDIKAMFLKLKMTLQILKN